MTFEAPRALNADEQRVLGLLLAAKFPGAEQLRVQASAAVVVGHCDCGCPTIDLAVPAGLPSFPLSSRLVPSEAQVTPAGDEPPGQIILFLDNGRLSSLEYVYFDEPPEAWPDPDRLHVTTNPR